jgi:hypothetical protein
MSAAGIGRRVPRLRRRSLVAVAVAVAVLGSGCGGAKKATDGTATSTSPSSAGTGGEPEPLPASSSLPATTAALTTAAPATAAPGVTTAAAPTACPVVPPRAAPAPSRPVYEVSVTIDAAARTASGTSSVRFTPDVAVDRLVLRLWPNSPQARSAGGSMQLHRIEVDRRVVAPSQPDPTTVVLPVPVASGATATIFTSWTITLAANFGERWTVAGQGVRLGSFVPLLPWEAGRGWATDPPTLVHGEATTSPVADWGLTVAAPGLDVVATGTPAGPGRWTATAVRDVAVSAGRFRRAEGTAAGAGPGGAAVPVVVVADAGVGDDPAAYVRKLVQVLPSLATRFGPYPYPSYTVALTASLRGGIENPMLIFQGPGSLGRSTSHEAAHMWFYALVGNDQGRDPWLDEGLATWAEVVYEGTLASAKARRIPAGAAGQAGRSTSYWDTRTSSYYAGVYIQGAQALAALGPPALVDCALRVFVERKAHAIATNADLLAALTPTFPEAAAVLARYGIKP